MRAAGDAPVLHLVKGALRALAVVASGHYVAAMHGVKPGFLAAATLTGLRTHPAFAHLADATVAMCSDSV